MPLWLGGRGPGREGRFGGQTLDLLNFRRLAFATTSHFSADTTPIRPSSGNRAQFIVLPELGLSLQRHHFVGRARPNAARCAVNLP
jgi:hypothetical protein